MIDCGLLSHLESRHLGKIQTQGISLGRSQMHQVRKLLNYIKLIQITYIVQNTPLYSTSKYTFARERERRISSIVEDHQEISRLHIRVLMHGNAMYNVSSLIIRFYICR